MLRWDLSGRRNCRVQAAAKEGLGICLEAKKCSRSVKGLMEDEAQQV